MADKNPSRPGTSGKSKTSAADKPKPIIIRGCGARFNGVYDIDELLFKLLGFVIAACVLGLLFL